MCDAIALYACVTVVQGGRKAILAGSAVGLSLCGTADRHASSHVINRCNVILPQCMSTLLALIPTDLHLLLQTIKSVEFCRQIVYS